ncbi:hypothetical protein C8R44DRAFT_726634 [Mycena epipterygia]|nr:hypothetical protein C8R44DRAFT_726634 [Mycena epipterygia]
MWLKEGRDANEMKKSQTGSMPVVLLSGSARASSRVSEVTAVAIRGSSTGYGRCADSFLSVVVNYASVARLRKHKEYGGIQYERAFAVRHSLFVPESQWWILSGGVCDMENAPQSKEARLHAEHRRCGLRHRVLHQTELHLRQRVAGGDTTGCGNDLPVKACGKGNIAVTVVFCPCGPEDHIIYTVLNEYAIGLFLWEISA